MDYEQLRNLDEDERLRLFIQRDGLHLKMMRSARARKSLTHEIYSLLEDPLGEVLSKGRVDTTKIKSLSIYGVAHFMLKTPGLMANLLEEIPETLPNVVNIQFHLPQQLNNVPKFLLFVNAYIFEPIMGHDDDQAFRVCELGGHIEIQTDKNFWIWFFRNEGEEQFASSQRWDRPLLELLLQKPNLTRLKGEGTCWYFLNHVFSNLSLQELCLKSSGNRGLTTDNWLPLLLGALKRQQGKKRKRHDIGFAGALHQLKTLALGEVDLGNHSDVLSFSKTIQEHNHLCHLVLDNLNCQGRNFSEAQLWEPFLDILRYSKTLETVRVTYEADNFANVESPYWEEDLFNILVERNHRIVSILFGYNDSSGNSCRPAQSDKVQCRLDLNYFGLSCFGTAAANTENFPQALITAIQKDKTKLEARQLIPCLFQIIKDNPYESTSSDQQSLIELLAQYVQDFFTS